MILSSLLKCNNYYMYMVKAQVAVVVNIMPKIAEAAY